METESLLLCEHELQLCLFWSTLVNCSFKLNQLSPDFLLNELHIPLYENIWEGQISCFKEPWCTEYIIMYFRASTSWKKPSVWDLRSSWLINYQLTLLCNIPEARRKPQLHHDENLKNRVGNVLIIPIVDMS
jgi:hypothetical protein